MKRYLCALLVMLAVGRANAGVIFSEDFEGGVNQDVITAGPIAGTGFEVVAGNVDHIKPPNAYSAMCGTGGSCLDTSGSGSRGEIRTVDEIEFLTPGLYYLSFSLQGWRDFNGLNSFASIQVILPGILDVTLARNGAANPYPVSYYKFEIFAPTTAKLTFRDLSGRFSFAGAILDDVEIGTAVPEPSSLLLMLPALAAIVAWKRRAKLPVA